MRTKRHENTSAASISQVLRAGLMGFTSLAAIGAVMLPASVAAQQASAAQQVDIAIPEQSMASALRAFARQVDKQIVFYSDDTERLRAGPLNGRFTEEEALRRILGDSGLEFTYVNERTIGIGRRDARGRFIGSGQTSDASGSTTAAGADPNVIVVSGRLLDAELSIQAKRDADQIIDVLSADQASQLPDQNVAESLSRIAGVSMIRNNESGDGEYISIRGLDSALSNIQFDGVNTGQVGGARRYTPNRSVPLQSIVAENIKEIRVAKSLLPEDEGEGIGGSVNIIARTPLDGDRDRINFDASARYGEFADKVGFDGGFNVTKIFSDSFGVNLAASFRRRFIHNYEIEAGSAYLPFLDSFENAAGETLTGADLWDLGITNQNAFYDIDPGFFSPDQIIYESYNYQIQEQTRDTYAASGAIDWRVSDTTLFTLSGRYNRTEIGGGEWDLGFDQDNNNFTLVGDRLVGQFFDLELDYNAQLEDSVDTMATAFLRGVTETDRLLLRYQVSYSKSKTSNPQTDLVFDTDSEFDDPEDNLNYMPYSFVNGFMPVPNASILNNAEFAQALQNIPENVLLDPFGLRLFQIDMTNERYMARVDATYRTDAEIFGGVLNNVRVGAKAERSDVYNFFDYYSQETAGLNLDGTYTSGGGNVVLPGGTDPTTLADFTSLDIGTIDFKPIGSPLAPLGIVTIPKFGKKAFKRFADNFRETFEASGDPSVFEQFFDGQEDVYAAYGQFDFEAGPFRLIAGARVEHYEGRFSAPLTLQGQVTLEGAEGEEGRALQLTTPGAPQEVVEAKASNTEILPRLAASYDVNDQLKLRFGAGYSIARPSYNQLGRASSVNISLSAEDPDGGVILPGVDTIEEAIAAGGLTPEQVSDVTLSVSSGNPDLENARSLNLDASIEFYPTRGTMLSVGLFYKEIKNFIFVGSESDGSSIDVEFVESLLSPQGLELLASIGGVQALVSEEFEPELSISRPENGGTAKLKGVEVGVNHRFSWAPGLLRNIAVNGNLTYTDSEAEFVVDSGLDATDAVVILGYYEEGERLLRRSSFFRAPEITANGSLVYDDNTFETALSVNYQSESFRGADRFGLDAFTGAYTQLDLFAGYTLRPGRGELQLFFEVADLLDSGTHPADLATLGRPRTAISAVSYNGREFRLGLRGRF
ncbi:MAG TPA: TonB-dependent receptor [Croceibacterium sp.]|nr:TonB-dependent receptor [Croceibacterium sp.]